MKRIYLAGPDVFYLNAAKVMQNMKELCKKYGCIGISPLDSEQIEPGNERTTKVIMQGNLKKIDQCDMVLANCNDFRGADMDSGTAVDLASGYFKNKQLFGYIDDLSTMKKRLLKHGGKKVKEDVVDEQCFRAEPIGNPINLMP